MSDFRIYYGDGSVFDSADGGPEIAPPRDVQVILQWNEDGPYFQSGCHYYVWWHEQWQGVQTPDGLFDYMIEPGWKRVLYGRTITNAEYRAIYQRAKAAKTTWRPWERRPE